MNRSVAALASVLAATLMLLAPALVNGYPIAFYDSADYIEMSLTGQLISYRTMPYALTVMKLHFGTSLWPIAVAQCALAAWTVRETLAALAPRLGNPEYLSVIAVLTVATSLPWYAGQLMPDIFVGIAALAMLVLAFDDSLSKPRRIFLALIVVLGGIAHASLMLLIVAAAAGAALLAWLARRQVWRPRYGALLGAALTTLIAVPGLHYAATGQAFYSRSGEIFFLARLIQDGIAKKYLDAVCPTPALKLCLYKDRLPATANDYLWGADSIFGSVGSWEYSGPESRAIVMGSIAKFPGAHLRAAIGLSLEQFGQFRTGDGNEPQIEATPFVINRYFPREIGAYQHALQQRGMIDFDAINRLHVPVAILSQVALAFLAFMLWRRQDRVGAAICLAALAILLLQAAITGALSNPNHRYQSRIIWIAPLIALIGAWRWREARR